MDSWLDRLPDEDALADAEGARAPELAPAPGKLSRAVMVPVMRSAAGSGIGKNAASAVSAAGSSYGSALPDRLRGDLEGALGADLSGVRVHTGEASAAAAREVSAHAFAQGQDIHFASGQYDPVSSEGQKLIAHEVAHTVQQQGAGVTLQAKLAVSSPGDRFELEADAFADAFVSGGTAQVSAGAVSSATIHRQSRRGQEEDEQEEPASTDRLGIVNGDAEEQRYEDSGQERPGERTWRDVLAGGATTAIDGLNDFLYWAGSDDDSVDNWADRLDQRIHRGIVEGGERAMQEHTPGLHRRIMEMSPYQGGQQERNSEPGLGSPQRTLWHVGPPHEPELSDDSIYRQGWEDRAPGARDFRRFMKWDTLLTGASIAAPHLDDATAAYRHFLYGNGREFRFDFAEFIAEDPGGRTVYRSAIQHGTQAALIRDDQLRAIPGTGAERSFQLQSETFLAGATEENWTKAVGNFTVWVNIDVRVVEAGERRQVSMDMTINGYDFYNFNPGQGDVATGARDADNAELVVAGVGDEFRQRGQSTHHFEFSATLAPAREQMIPTDSLMQFRDDGRPVDVAVEQGVEISDLVVSNYNVQQDEPIQVIFRANNPTDAPRRVQVRLKNASWEWNGEPVDVPPGVHAKVVPITVETSGELSVVDMANGLGARAPYQVLIRGGDPIDVDGDGLFDNAPEGTPAPTLSVEVTAQTGFGWTLAYQMASSIPEPDPQMFRLGLFVGQGDDWAEYSPEYGSQGSFWLPTDLAADGYRVKLEPSYWGVRGEEKILGPFTAAALSSGEPIAISPKLEDSSLGPSETASADVASARGSGGVPLDDGLRAELESFSTTSLSDVRVHTGASSATAAGAIGALAYADGKDIHFGAGQYDPSSVDGKKLIAHEVAHTIQATAAGLRVQTKLAISGPGDANEMEADRFADAFVSGASSFQIAGSMSDPGVLHRVAMPRRDADDVQASAEPGQAPEARAYGFILIRGLLQGGADFVAMVLRELAQIANTRTGGALLRVLGNLARERGFELEIFQSEGNAALVHARSPADEPHVQPAETRPIGDGHVESVTPGRGGETTIEYSGVSFNRRIRDSADRGTATIEEARAVTSDRRCAPHYVALFHELVHVLRALRGEMLLNRVLDPVIGNRRVREGNVSVSNIQGNQEELATIGAGRHGGDSMTENQLRAELGLEPRTSHFEGCFLPPGGDPMTLPISRKGAGEVGAGAVEATAAARSSGGAPLEAGIRGELESFTGADLGGVRVHTGESSAAAASSVGALAYAEGQSIHFAAGRYDTASPSGKKLLAHEVAHTLQDVGGMQTKLAVSAPGDAHELEADRFADAFASGASSFRLSSYAGSARLHRQAAEPAASEEEIAAEFDNFVALDYEIYALSRDASGYRVCLGLTGPLANDDSEQALEAATIALARANNLSQLTLVDEADEPIVLVVRTAGEGQEASYSATWEFTTTGESSVAIGSEAFGLDAEVEQNSELRGAIREGNRGLRSWIAGRTRGISGDLALGPTLDQTYFYRMGRRGTHGWGMNEAELTATREELIGQGFPRLQEDELRSVNYTSMSARSEVNTNTRLVAKHFPGGDETLESTEEHLVHFGDDAATQRRISDFERVIASSDSPDMMMIAHSTYGRGGFEGMGEPEMGHTLGAATVNGGEATFANVPASLNPAIVRYLREDLGYDGLVIGDWYNMDSIYQFVDQVVLPFPADRNFKTVLLANAAGVDFIIGVNYSTGSIEEGLQACQSAAPQVYADFIRFADASIQRIWATFRVPPGVTLDVNALTPFEKILVRVFNRSQRREQDWMRGYLQRNPQNRRVIEVFMEQGVGDNDIWNRTGVMTMLQRQLVIESLTGRRFARPPTNVADEERWFDALRNDATFMEEYNRIDWDSPEVQRMFAEVAEDYYPSRDRRAAAGGAPGGTTN